MGVAREVGVEVGGAADAVLFLSGFCIIRIVSFSMGKCSSSASLQF